MHKHLDDRALLAGAWEKMLPFFSELIFAFSLLFLTYYILLMKANGTEWTYVVIIAMMPISTKTCSLLRESYEKTKLEIKKLEEEFWHKRIKELEEKISKMRNELDGLPPGIVEIVEEIIDKLLKEQEYIKREIEYGKDNRKS